jgi:predicted ATPase
MSVKLIFEGIRCFATRQEAVLRPLTLLVGENSSGKSTFLALCRIARSIAQGFDFPAVFNEPPFLLGAYDRAARKVVFGWPWR